MQRSATTSHLETHASLPALQKKVELPVDELNMFCVLVSEPGGLGTGLPSAEDPQASEGPAAVVTAGDSRRWRKLSVG